MNPETPFFLQGSAGRLEALIREPAGAHAPGAALILHPHPLYGGNMHNKVVFALQKSLGAAGMATLRFNFRGVGASGGVYADGIGEQDDLRRGLAHLAEHFPGLPLYLAGFSFGAYLSLKVGVEDERIAGILSLGTPVGWGDVSFMEACAKPMFFIHGDADAFCDPTDLAEEFERLLQPKGIAWIEGADHFFTGKLGELAARLEDGLKFLLEPRA